MAYLPAHIGSSGNSAADMGFWYSFRILPDRLKLIRLYLCGSLRPSISFTFRARAGHFAATPHSDIVCICAHDFGIMVMLSVWQNFLFFSCIYNPQITISPTSSFSVSFNGNCVKNHPKPWNCPLIKKKMTYFILCVNAKRIAVFIVPLLICKQTTRFFTLYSKNKQNTKKEKKRRRRKGGFRTSMSCIKNNNIHVKTNDVNYTKKKITVNCPCLKTWYLQITKLSNTKFCTIWQMKCSAHAIPENNINFISFKTQSILQFLVTCVTEKETRSTNCSHHI